MPITATTPTTVPAQAEAVYPSYWIYSLVIDGSDTNHVQVTTTLRKYRTLDDGSIEFSPVDPNVTFTIPDVLTLATTDQSIGAVVSGLIAGVQAYGTANSLI